MLRQLRSKRPRPASNSCTIGCRGPISEEGAGYDRLTRLGLTINHGALYPSSIGQIVLPQQLLIGAIGHDRGERFL